MLKQAIRFASFAAAALLLQGCISAKSFVDPVLPKASKADVAAVASPQPVQALFEFRSKGVANAAATQMLNDSVYGALRSSGIFSEVSTTPVTGGRRLVITIDNVPITNDSDAMAKGFGTGLTFGLVGTMVTDGYACEATYTGANGEASKLSYRHAIHTTIGNASGPPGIEGKTPNEAAKDVASQIAWSVVRDLSKGGKL